MPVIKKNNPKKKHGFTMVELVVAMAIFIIVTTLAVGAFVTVARMKALTSTMKNAQQKTRIALEMITRLSRQAEKVIVLADGNTMELWFNTKATPYGVRFQILNDELHYSECQTALALACTTWKPSTELYGGISLLNETGKDSKFIKLGSVPPTLGVELYGKVENPGNNQYYEDEINLTTTIVLEGIR